MNSTAHSDGFEAFQYQAGVSVLPIAAVAIVGAWFITGDQGTPLDQALLLPFAAFIALLEILLLRKRTRPNTIWMLTLWSTFAYLVLSLGYEIARGDYAPGMPPAAVWLLVTHFGAFVIVDARHIERYSWLYFGLSMAATASGLWLTEDRSELLVNACAQWVLTSLAVVVLLHTYTHVRNRFGQMHELARADPLTGLANRRFAEDAMQAHMLGGPDRAGFSLLLIDVDHFKSVNDSRGHAIGDQALKELARTLANQLREGDLLARWGGEEFLALLPGMNAPEAAQFASRLCEAVGRQPCLGDLALTVSVGVATRGADEDIESLLGRADRALYRAKSGGRNRAERDAA